MLLPKFDFDRSFDAAYALVLERTGLDDALAVSLALTITRRDAAVVRMAHVELLSPEWMKASERIARCDEELAKVGLA